MDCGLILLIMHKRLSLLQQHGFSLGIVVVERLPLAANSAVTNSLRMRITHSNDRQREQARNSNNCDMYDTPYDPARLVQLRLLKQNMNYYT